MVQTTPVRQHTLVLTASVVIVLAGIKAAAPIIVPFILAVFIAVICSPLVHILMRWKLPRTLAILVILLAIIVFSTLLAGVIGSSLNQLASSIPVYREQISVHLTWFVTFLEKFNIHISLASILPYFNPGAAISLATNILAGFSGVMANFFLLLLVVLLMLFEAPSMSSRLHIMLSDPHMQRSQIDRFLESVKHYMAIKTVISLITGCGVSLFLWWMGVEFFVLWGLLAFLLNYIPNIGSIIAAVPPILLAAIQLNFSSAVIILIFFIALNTVIGNLIEPRIMGKGLGLSTLFVFLSLIFWGWLLGSVGMLLSVPLTMILKIGLESSEDGAWLSHLMTTSDVKNNSREHP